MYCELLTIQEGELDLLWGGDRHQIILEVVHPVAIRILSSHAMLRIAASSGEFLPNTGEERGGPETGVPGFEPIGQGELIILAPGLDTGREVAGEFGLGLILWPG